MTRPNVVLAAAFILAAAADPKSASSGVSMRLGDDLLQPVRDSGIYEPEVLEPIVHELEKLIMTVLNDGMSAEESARSPEEANEEAGGLADQDSSADDHPRQAKELMSVPDIGETGTEAAAGAQPTEVKPVARENNSNRVAKAQASPKRATSRKTAFESSPQETPESNAMADIEPITLAARLLNQMHQVLDYVVGNGQELADAASKVLDANESYTMYVLGTAAVCLIGLVGWATRRK